MSRKEEREYAKVWKRKGKGYTKPLLGKTTKKKTTWAKKRAAEAEKRRKENRAAPDTGDAGGD